MLLILFKAQKKKKKKKKKKSLYFKGTLLIIVYLLVYIVCTHHSFHVLHVDILKNVEACVKLWILCVQEVYSKECVRIFTSISMALQK